MRSVYIVAQHQDYSTVQCNGRKQERKRERQTDRDRQRQTETDRDRQRQTETDRDRQRQPDRQEGRQAGRQAGRQTDTQTGKNTPINVFLFTPFPLPSPKLHLKVPSNTQHRIWHKPPQMFVFHFFKCCQCFGIKLNLSRICTTHHTLAKGPTPLGAVLIAKT